MAVNTENIWEDLSIPLKQFIRKRVGNQEDVDDILQDVFCRIHRNIGTLREADKIHAWVYAITRNSIADFYRSQKTEEDITEFFEQTTRNMEDELKANTEISQCLKIMIDYLPDKYKEAIVLTEFEDFTQMELAERTGLSLSGAKSRVQRARSKLKDMLLGCCHFEFDRLGNIIDYRHKCKDCRFC